jgi:hypothetical protein
MKFLEKYSEVGGWWLTPIILGTWESEIGRFMGQGQPWQVVLRPPSPK